MNRPALQDAVVELRLHDAASLFDNLSLSPLQDGRLDAGVAGYLMERVSVLPEHAPLRLRLHLPGAQASEELPDALRHALSACADAQTRELRELFRTGRRALLIGLLVLTLCLLVVVHGEDLVPGAALPTILTEGLKIIGWVSMWRPTEIFLYDWMPIVRRRKLMRRLASARIETILIRS